MTSPQPTHVMPTTDSIEIRVRYNECDPMGLAHHTAYPTWFEMGRTELCRRSGISYRELEAQGAFLAVVALTVRYRRPVRYDDLVVLETTISNATRVRLEHAYRLLRAGELLATGATTLACLDRNGTLSAMPDHLWAHTEEP